MSYPDFSRPFVLHMDASQEGLGTVLYQKKEQGMGVIGYASRHLSPAERNYHLHSGRLEFLHDDVGHLGADRVKELARERFYCPHMASDINHFVMNVCQCIKSKSSSSELF